MKKAILALLLMASISHGANYCDRVWYWCHQNGHTDVDQTLAQALVMKGKKGALSYICFNADSWKIEGAPDKATLDALDGAIVDAWVKGQNNTAEGTAIYDGDVGKLIQAVVARLKANNPTLNVPAGFKDEVIAKFKQLKEAE